MTLFLNRNNKVTVPKGSDKLLSRYVRLVLWLYGIKSHKHHYVHLMDRIMLLRKNSGASHTVPYLKKAHMLLMHYLSGNPVLNAGGEAPRVGVLHGLPIIIPHPVRVLILSGSAVDIRVTLCILSVFRIIPFKGKLKLDTITDCSQGLTTRMYDSEVSKVWKLFKDLRGINPVGRQSLLNLKTAGPNFKTSILGAPLDAFAFKDSPLLAPFRIISNYFSSGLYSELLNEIDSVKGVEFSKTFVLGKLSEKVEPAGKIRVFAIADVWTQSVLTPIHDHVFSILKVIRQDGCFDQIAPLKLLMTLLKNKEDKTTYSYDLSAATDRFPIDLQVQVLSKLYTPEVAQAWKSLLVDRDWWHKGKPLRYGVGQPMGALSSWGVFSLTHHFVVQACAQRVGQLGWFTEYALLGDDVVIANSAVAKEYYRYMTVDLGVQINLSKSLVSSFGLVEFAKRLISPETEYTPVGPKNLALCLKAPSNISTLFMEYLEKGGIIPNANVINQMIYSLSHDIVTISRGKMESLLWTIIGPFGFIDSGSRFGPSRVESSLTYFKVYGVHLDLIDEVTDVLDAVLKSGFEEVKARALEKTKISYEALVNHKYVPYCNNRLHYNDLTSFRMLKVTGLESYYDLMSVEFKVAQSSSGLPTLTEIIKFKLNSIPLLSPLSNCLVKQKVQRPRFRSVGIDYFSKVNKGLRSFFEDEEEA